MPYTSLAQARKFHSDPKLRKYAAEYDAATDFSKLPERARKKKKPSLPALAANLRGGR